jgi:hypothetical protein
MADRLGDEDKVRRRIGRQLGVELVKRNLVVGKTAAGIERRHEFDGVSPNGQVVIEVKTNQLNPTSDKPRGRYDSAIKQALSLDLYMLSRISAKTKFLVLTDRPLFDLCCREMDGLLAPDTKIVHCLAD